MEDESSSVVAVRSAPPVFDKRVELAFISFDDDISDGFLLAFFVSSSPQTALSSWLLVNCASEEGGLSLKSRWSSSLDSMFWTRGGLLIEDKETERGAVEADGFDVEMAIVVVDGGAGELDVFLCMLWTLTVLSAEKCGKVTL